jgi:hypothetical protein
MIKNLKSDIDNYPQTIPFSDIIVTFTSIGDFDKLSTNIPELHPFIDREYLRSFSDNFNCDPYHLVIKDQNKILMEGYFDKLGEQLILLGMRPVLGGQELTDYGDVIYHGDINKGLGVKLWGETMSYLSTMGIKSIRLDYLRADSPTLLFLKGLSNIEISDQEVAPFIELKDGFEAILNRINKKDRQELKRKLRRLSSIETNFEVIENISDHDFHEFIRLHKLSDPAKEKFMSLAMEGYFHKLIKLKLTHWKLNLAFLKIEGKNAATVLFFSNGKVLMGYNSGYDPLFNYYSPGLMSKAKLMQWAISKGYETFDTLRGNERYKYDLGAIDLKLYKAIIKL